VAVLTESSNLYTNAKDVFLLFLIPIGGGIPAGVVLGNSRGVSWEVMTILYLLSDIVLACVFDPIMKLFIHFGKRSSFIAKINQSFKKSVLITTSKYGAKPQPHLLVFISFGVDPMTGRAATLMAGHGFFSGWAMAITGDMFFYFLVMASTLWLNNLLGDGTWAAIIITVAVIVLPSVINRIRTRFKKTH
jgi:hypothetical protein